MEKWSTPFVITRQNSDGSESIVYSSATLKDSKYWLSFIALPGDAIWKTPLHPTCSGKSSLTYFSHLISRGKIGYNESDLHSQRKQHSDNSAVT